MKTTYTCEQCGKTFDSDMECKVHEIECTCHDLRNIVHYTETPMNVFPRACITCKHCYQSMCSYRCEILRNEGVMRNWDKHYETAVNPVKGICDKFEWIERLKSQDLLGLEGYANTVTKGVAV